MENHLGMDNRSADEDMGMAHFQDHLQDKKGSLLYLRTFWPPASCFCYFCLYNMPRVVKWVLRKSVIPLAEVLLLQEKKPSESDSLTYIFVPFIV
ncbi:hypothetical protein [Brevibacillus laterosporus]|uniref:hypothetical protein n=1 Tax=Brevibacillus laterosporus TaxID=1465 RepID=UPI001A7E364D|nr:hypothetical protein [Brevibacillus laterosporus]